MTEAESESEPEGTEEETAAIAAEFEESLKRVDALAKDAPEEIRDDMKMAASFFSDLMSTDLEDEDASAAFDEKYSDDKMEASSNRLEAFLKDTCGIDTELGNVDFNDGDVEVDDGGVDPDTN